MKNFKEAILLICLLTLINYQASAICFLTNGTSLFAGSDKGIFISSDNGATWKTAGKLLISNPVYDILLKEGILYVNAYKYGVCKSTDNGATWIPVSDGLPKGTYGLENITSLVQQENKLYAVFNQKGIYSFDEVSSKWVASSYPAAYMSGATSNGQAFFVGSGEGLFFRKVSEYGWNKAKKGFPSKDNYVSCVYVAETTVFVGLAYQDAYVSYDNGGTWLAANTGLPKGIEITHFISQGSNAYASTKSKEIYFSADKGKTWKLLPNAPKEEVESFALLGNKLYVEAGDLYFTENNGETFVKSNFDEVARSKASKEEDDAVEAAAVAKKKRQLAFMREDSNHEFPYNQASTTLFEDTDHKKKYYRSITKFKGEIAMVQEEDKNSVLYKTLIFGWTTDDNTAQEDEEDADYTKKATKEIIEEKVKISSYKSSTTSNSDGSTRTVLIDSVGGVVFETVLHKNYFQLIIYGKKWRTAPIEGMNAGFSISDLLRAKNTRKTIKSSYPFEFIGDKDKVSLYATSRSNDVIFAVDNASEKTVYVKIKVAFQCVDQGISTSYQTQEIIWTITVPANSQKTYDDNQAACIVEGCKKKTNAWKIAQWAVEY